MKIARILTATASALLVTLALSACENAVTPGSAPKVDPETAKIGLLLPDSVTARYENADKPYFAAELKSLCPRCKLLYANADGDASKQQQQAESMLAQGVSVLVLDPFDSEAAASIAADAQSNGIPVISYDRLVNSEHLDYYISFDNEKVGKLQAQALVEKLRADDKGKGDHGILMLNGSPTDNNASLFKKGAHEVIDKSGYKLLAEYDTPGWDPAKAQDWVTGQITQYGDRIDGIYAANDVLAGAAIASLKAADVSPIRPVIGQDAELAAIQRILAGDQYMTVYKAIQPEAEKAAQLAVALTKREHPEGETMVRVAGTDIPSFLLSVTPVRANNVEDTVVKDKFYGPNTVAKICTDYKSACAEHGIG
ncbi:ABC transporter substrate-binding protein [Leifsonia poae]|uniref:ABC transporter substrate-binding protein n=1 Tax=Leifsonia poae TaxID=110933 RepID=UPI003D674E54